MLFLISCSTTNKNSHNKPFAKGHYVQHVYNPSGIGHWTKLTFYITLKDSSEISIIDHPFRDTQEYRITWAGKYKYKMVLVHPKNDLDSFVVRRYPKGLTRRIKKITQEYLLIKTHGETDTLWKVLK